MVVTKIHDNACGIKMTLQKIQNNVCIVSIAYFNPAVGRKFQISNSVFEHIGFRGKFFKCCSIGNWSKQRGMFASGKCQCAFYNSVSIFETVDGFRFR